MTTGQLLRWEVKVKIPVCPTHPTWEEWEVKAQGLNLDDTMQKAALEALTTCCVKHADVVATTAAKVILLPKQHSRHGIEREAFLSAQGNPHHSLELVTSIRFSKAMYDTYQVMVGESMFRTFTIRGVTDDAIRLHPFPFSLLEKAKQWFYAERDAINTWDKCSKAFLAKFFPVGKTNALCARISSFQEYITVCPHHGIHKWFLIQTFYHGLKRTSP
jgi:hypothetical protein